MAGGASKTPQHGGSKKQNVSSAAQRPQLRQPPLHRDAGGVVLPMRAAEARRPEDVIRSSILLALTAQAPEANLLTLLQLFQGAINMALV